MKYFLGIDGGGTKTTVALSDMEGRIVKKEIGKPSNLRNIGFKESLFNLKEVIEKVVPQEGEVVSSAIALASIEEEYREEGEIIAKEIEKFLGGKVVVVSDQVIAFRAGTDKKDGVVIISGTGSVARGWKEEREIKVGGWGWLADEGAAFWTGIEVFRLLGKVFDKREESNLMEKIIREEWKINSPEELNREVYKSFMEKIPLLSIVADRAAKEGDLAAKKILSQAGEELSLMAKRVIEHLSLEKESFPVIKSGGMFKSEVVESILRENILKIAPRANLIKLEVDPVEGAIKLAKEMYE